jgi:transposase InsO family protein
VSSPDSEPGEPPPIGTATDDARVPPSVAKAKKKVLFQQTTVQPDDNDELLYKPITLKTKPNRTATALVDPGATDSFIDSFLASKLRGVQRRKQTIDVGLANGTSITSSEQVRLTYKLCGKTWTGWFVAIPMSERQQVIVGRPWLTKFNPSIDWTTNEISFDRPPARPEPKQTAQHERKLKCQVYATHVFRNQWRTSSRSVRETLLHVRLHNVTTSKKATSSSESFNDLLSSLITEYHDIFGEIPDEVPQRDVSHTIPLVPNAKPPAPRTYRLSLRELQELKEQLDILLRKGWIQPSSSSFGAPVLFAFKKNGKLRMCIDYRQLNDLTVKDGYVLPRIDECFDMLGKGKVFSKIDLASGYHQIPIAPEDIPKTAFSTRYGTFEWRVMPFGLTSAPATFQRLMNSVLQPLLDDCVIVYLDDILIYSRNEEEHIAHLRRVFDLLKKNKLYTQSEKCEFGLHKLEFLGHVVGANGIEMDPAKVSIVQEWPVPTNLTELRSFLGLCNYYRRFINQFALIAQPLTQMTRNDTPWCWTSDCDRAFQQLKTAMTTAPVLAYPDPARAFVVFFDASSTIALGGVLCQADDRDVLHPVAFESRKLTDTEKHYPVHELELLAFVHCLQKWRHYLDYRRFQVFTDNRALETIHTNKTPSLRMLRWIDAIQAYQFDIHHISRTKNVVADILSKAPHAKLSALMEDDVAVNHVTMISRLIQHLPSEQLLVRIRDAYHNDDDKWNEVVKRLSAKYDEKRRKEKGKNAHRDTKSASPTDLSNVQKMPVAQTEETNLRRSTRIASRTSTNTNPKTSLNDPVEAVHDDDHDDTAGKNEHVTNTVVVRTVVTKKAKSAEKKRKEIRAIQQKNAKDTAATNSTMNTNDDISDLERYVLEDGLLYTLKDAKRRLCIPTSDPTIIREIIGIHHDPPTAGHFKTSKTYDSIRRHFYWPGMFRHVQRYVKTCDLCQKNSAPNQHPPGLLMPLEIPTSRWTDIAMDDIVGLPATSSGHDAILTVIDRFSHRARFIPHHSTDTAKDLAQLFLDNVATQFGFPSRIVSDRDTRFTSKFWNSFLNLLQMESKMSVARHQQTDGLAERTNRTIEDILRNFSTYTNDWDTTLSLAEFAYNRAMHSTIGMAPFEADLGRLPHSPLVYTRLKLEACPTPSTQEFVENLEHTRNLVYDLIRDAQDRQKRYADTKRRDLRFQKGEKVLLNRNFLTVDHYRQQHRQKLLPRWIGPFEIVAVVGPLSYRLKMPVNSKAHDVFHVSALKPYHEPDMDDPRRFTRPPPVLIDEEGVKMEVEAILDSRTRRNKKEYLVKWTGYPNDDNTWIPSTDLHAPDLLKAFLKSQRNTTQSRSIANSAGGV